MQLVYLSNSAFKLHLDEVTIGFVWTVVKTLEFILTQYSRI